MIPELLCLYKACLAVSSLTRTVYSLKRAYEAKWSPPRSNLRNWPSRAYTIC